MDTPQTWILVTNHDPDVVVVVFVSSRAIHFIIAKSRDARYRAHAREGDFGGGNRSIMIPLIRNYITLCRAMLHRKNSGKGKSVALEYAWDK